mmetsp:Transcript_22921/g.58507  ORF Transcript_22921/g.58507 Transcript_22921/m.58507 type:complete len:212 (-) Transcript_22921:663-1298(-)
MVAQVQGHPHRRTRNPGSHLLTSRVAWRAGPGQRWVAHQLRLEVGARVARKQLGVQLGARRHGEPPLVLGLAAQVEVHVRHQQPVQVARQRGRAAAVGRGHVRGAVKVAKVLVRGLPVPAGELVGEGLGAHAVDGAHKVRVGDGGVARLHAPQRLAQRAHRGAGVEHDLRAVDAKRVPVERVVPAVADVDRNAAVHRLKHGVARVALHVVG